MDQSDNSTDSDSSLVPVPAKTKVVAKTSAISKSSKGKSQQQQNQQKTNELVSGQKLQDLYLECQYLLLKSKLLKDFPTDSMKKMLILQVNRVHGTAHGHERALVEQYTTGEDFDIVKRRIGRFERKALRLISQFNENGQLKEDREPIDSQYYDDLASDLRRLRGVTSHILRFISHNI